jgi:hypothetical protein
LFQAMQSAEQDAVECLQRIEELKVKKTGDF